MKYMPSHLRFAVVSCVLILSTLASGQTITMVPIASSSFCTGDSVTVNFNATGIWGHKNAFTLQLSDPSGSFSSGFTNLASLQDTLPGSFKISALIPEGIANSTGYRLRILGAVPYTTSQDNGSDFSICTTPRFYGIEWAPTAISAGISERFDIISPTPLATYTWILGADASPDTIVGNRANIIFLSGGDKIITINATTTCGCSVSKTYSVHVYDCSKPVIPKRSIVMNNDSATTLSNSVFWVNPGVKLYVIGSYDTVFQEPGSTVIARGNESVFYLKTGSSISNEGIYSTFILADGSSITGFDQYMDGKVTCSTLDFDYTDAPPNAAHPLGVVQARTLASLTLTPNPTAGSLTVQNLPLGVSEVTVLNILGESIQEYKNVRSTELTLDLSKFAPGTYYIRFETPNSVITKMVVKQ